MRIRQVHSPWLWVLLPSLIIANPTISGSDTQQLNKLEKRASDTSNTKEQVIAPASERGNKDIPTKYAPVDGQDGIPHAGPWVGKDADAVQKGKKTSPKSEDIPDSVARLEKEGYGDKASGSKSQRIPDKNDGVMDDPHRQAPERGTTGTEGGVSAKLKKEQAKEAKTGEKTEKKPEAPKEAPLLPHAEEEKLKKSSGSTKVVDGDTVDGTAGKDKAKGAHGIEKPTDLPKSPGNKKLDSDSDKDNDDTNPHPPPKTDLHHPSYSSFHSSSTSSDGVIQPLHSFALAFIMIIFSEIGDKTFLVAALMAMRHDRAVVFTAAFSALITMTVLSAVLGHAVPSLLPRKLVAYAAAALFLVFGAKMLREGLMMEKEAGVGEEMKEVEAELEEKELLAKRAGYENGRGRRRKSSGLDITPDQIESGLGRKSRPGGMLASLPDSPTSDDDAEGMGGTRRGGARGGSASVLKNGVLSGVNNLFTLILSPAWVQTFVMTFLGEWGDRSQIATIAMAAGQDYWWVTGGAVIGHGICTGVAVIGGRALAGKVSLRVVTLGGALAFLFFGIIYFAEAFMS